MDASEDLPVTRGGRCRADDPHLAFVADEELAKEHAQWRAPEMRERGDVNRAFFAERADAVISASAAGQRNEAPGQDLSAEDAKFHGKLVRTAKGRELAAREKFEAFKPISEGAPLKPIAQTRWALSWKRRRASRALRFVRWLRGTKTQICRMV